MNELFSEQETWKHTFILSKKFKRFIDLIPEAMIISAEDGRIVCVNHTAIKIFQYTESEFLKCTIEDLVPSNVKPHHKELRAFFFENPRPRCLEDRNYELCAIKKDGSSFAMESALFSMKTDKGPLAINIMRDVSKTKQFIDQTTEVAFLDPLTQLPNRRFFDLSLSKNLARAKRHQQAIALMFVDLDKFKPVNDQYGHEAGDHLLQVIAKRLAKAVREEDFLARIGGDEFMIIVYPMASSSYMEEIAQRILKACREPISITAENETSVSASIGIQIGQAGKFDEKKLFQLADKAMYTAKSKGGDQFYINP